MRDYEKGLITLNRDETKMWHEGPHWFRADLSRSALIKAYGEKTPCRIMDMDGTIVHGPVSPSELVRS